MTPEPEPYIERFQSATDSNVISCTQETLVANTNKEIAIPAGVIGFHVWSQSISQPIFFRVDSPASVQTTNVPIVEGFLPPMIESARILYNEATNGTHKLNLISAGAGTLLLEFWG
jgi:hypothetical protein